MNNLAQRMLDDKKKRSPFLTLASGDSQIGEITAIKTINKQGFSGDEEEFLRVVLKCDFPELGTVIKNFDNASKSFLETLVNSGADVGDVVEISRQGEMKKTKYTIEILTKNANAQPEDPGAYQGGFAQDVQDEIDVADIPM